MKNNNLNELRAEKSKEDYHWQNVITTELKYKRKVNSKTTKQNKINVTKEAVYERFFVVFFINAYIIALHLLIESG